MAEQISGAQWIANENDSLLTENYISGQRCYGYIYAMNPMEWTAVTVFDNGQEMDSFHFTKKDAKAEVEKNVSLSDVNGYGD
jgi:hypothetical protein